MENDKDEEEMIEYEEDVPEAGINFIPQENMAKMQHGLKMITSTSMETVGHRMISSSAEGTLSLWDFGGMNCDPQAFKVECVCEGQEIKRASFSPNGEHILVISNDIQGFILDREAVRVLETVKGNPYVFDCRSNKGHSKMLTDGIWSPLKAEEFVTSSGDGSVRVWDMLQYEKILSERRVKTHKYCMTPKGDKNRKLIPTACAYSNRGKLIVAGCEDGSIHVYDPVKSQVNVALVSRKAHSAHITSVCFSYDDFFISTRSLDDSMCLFDVRNGLKEPLHIFKELFCSNERTNCIFSPNDHMILTGTSLDRGETVSHLYAYDRNTFEQLHDISTNDSGTVTVEWHPRLNQLLIGTSTGGLKIYYDSTFSHNGALLFANKQPRTKHNANQFYTRDTLLTYDEDTERQARIGQRASKFREGAELNPYLKTKKETKKRIPQLPTDANSSYPSLHQHLVQQIMIPKRTPEAEYYENHPREAILRHANAPKYWTAKAYDKTQPHAIFCEDEEPDMKKKKTF